MLAVWRLIAVSLCLACLRVVSVILVLYVRLRKDNGFKLFKFDWCNTSCTILNDFYITPSPSGYCPLSVLLTESLGTLGEMSVNSHLKALRIAHRKLSW